METVKFSGRGWLCPADPIPVGKGYPSATRLNVSSPKWNPGYAPLL